MVARSDWTPDEEKALAENWAAGFSAGQIGAALHRTKNSIVGRAHRMGLAARPSPIRREGNPAIFGPSLPPAAGRVTLPSLASVAAPVAALTTERAACPPSRPRAKRQLPPLPAVAVIHPRPPPGAPIPPALVVAPPPPARAVGRRTCAMPMWGHTEKTKFGADGYPPFCKEPAQVGSYCAEHAKIVFMRIRRPE
jgi:GcrA cell cycle regulator